MRKTSLILLTLSLFLFTNPVEVFSALKGGCAKIDITPPIGVWLTGFESRTKPCDNIEDELYAKALVLNDGQNTIAIVTTDLLWISLEITNKIRTIVNKETGIPKENILISASHTHFGPKIFEKDILGPEGSLPDSDYVQILIKKIASSILIAYKNMQEIRIGTTKGSIPEIIYNRRAKSKNGSMVMAFSIPQSDALPVPIVKELFIGSMKTTITIPSKNPDLIFGPVDPEVSVLKIEDTNGETLGSLINFACHPSIGTDHLYSISADFPGYATKLVEESEGGICLFAQGVSGDISPLLRGYKARKSIGKAIGGEVIRKIQFVPTTDTISLMALTKTVKLPLKEIFPEEKDIEINVDSGTKFITTEIQVLKIGDTYILGLPGEIVVNIGFDIKIKAGLENLFIITLCNDAIGYVCDSKTYEEGGYQPGTATLLAKGSGEIMLEEALNLLNRISQK